jgi:hypothetical protein
MSESKQTVYLLWHTHEMPDGDEESKLIGVYSSEARAMEAQRRVLSQPGFRDAPEGFEIARYQVDTDHWVEGYVTV